MNKAYAKPSRKRNTARLLALSAGHFMNDFYTGIVHPTLYIFAQALSLTLGQQGFIAFAFNASGTWLQPLVGFLVDRHGKTWLLLLSVVWISFWVCISGLITNYYLLVLVLILGGTASSLYHPLGSATAIKLMGNREGTGLSVFMTIGGFAIAVSPALSVPVALNLGLDKLVYFMIPGFVTAAIMYAVEVHRIDDLDGGDTNIGTPSAGKTEPLSLFWIGILILIATVRAWLRISLATFGINLFISKSVDPTVCAYILSFQLLFSSVFTLAGGYLSDIMGSKKVLLVSMVLTTLFLSLVVKTSGILAVASFVLAGSLNAAPNSANIVMARNYMPNNTTFANGLIMGLAAGLGGIGTLYQGRLADTFGILPSFLFLLIPLAVSCVLTIVLPRTSPTSCQQE
ncbi:MAG TPA: MFS transporter [Clostridia bacterium]|nr:MFS transporter [Clostridia bacterium]